MNKGHSITFLTNQWT